MSEFAKQAHPDAAHRERLSREIPGLSPRQVQVWFQNRYVKHFPSVSSVGLTRIQTREDKAFDSGRSRADDENAGSTRRL